MNAGFHNRRIPAGRKYPDNLDIRPRCCCRELRTGHRVVNLQADAPRRSLRSGVPLHSAKAADCSLPRKSTQRFCAARFRTSKVPGRAALTDASRMARRPSRGRGGTRTLTLFSRRLKGLQSPSTQERLPCLQPLAVTRSPLCVFAISRTCFATEEW